MSDEDLEGISGGLPHSATQALWASPHAGGRVGIPKADVVWEGAVVLEGFLHNQLTP